MTRGLIHSATPSKANKMSEIPEDIMRAAIKALEQEDWTVEGDSVWHEPGDLQGSEMKIYPIAKAIWEERQRCAKIADAEAERCFENEGDYPAARVHDFMVVARRISKAILNQTEE